MKKQWSNSGRFSGLQVMGTLTTARLNRKIIKQLRKRASSSTRSRWSFVNVNFIFGVNQSKQSPDDWQTDRQAKPTLVLAFKIYLPTKEKKNCLVWLRMHRWFDDGLFSCCCCCFIYLHFSFFLHMQQKLTTTKHWKSMQKKKKTK